MEKEDFDIEKIIKAYEKMEAIAARTIDLSAKQLENRISSAAAKTDLYAIADEFCDLCETEEAKSINKYLRQQKEQEDAVQKGN